MPMHSHVQQLHEQHSTLVRIRYAHTTWQIIVTSLPMARDCYGTGRNVPETRCGYYTTITCTAIRCDLNRSHCKCSSTQCASPDLISGSQGRQDLLRSLERWYKIYTTQLTDDGEHNLCRLADHTLGTRSMSCITCIYCRRYSSIDNCGRE